MTSPEPRRRTPYSPDRRTALVLTGTGTDGAYHAGTIRALTEAGVRVDLVAGIYQIALLSEAAVPVASTWLTERWGAVLAATFAPTALPTRLPQLVTAVLAMIVIGLLVAAFRAMRTLPARRGQTGGLWW